MLSRLTGDWNDKLETSVHHSTEKLLYTTAPRNLYTVGVNHPPNTTSCPRREEGFLWRLFLTDPCGGLISTRGSDHARGRYSLLS